MKAECALAKPIDPKDRGAVRALYNTANEANDIARQLRDDALELATLVCQLGTSRAWVPAALLQAQRDLHAHERDPYAAEQQKPELLRAPGARAGASENRAAQAARSGVEGIFRCLTCVSPAEFIPG